VPFIITGPGIRKNHVDGENKAVIRSVPLMASLKAAQEKGAQERWRRVAGGGSSIPVAADRTCVGKRSVHLAHECVSLCLIVSPDARFIRQQHNISNLTGLALPYLTSSKGSEDMPLNVLTNVDTSSSASKKKRESHELTERC
jgi:hypothetical protein